MEPIPPGIGSTMERYISIIQNLPVNNRVSKEDEHSFSNLAPRKLTQSQNIKLGNYMQEFFSKYVLAHATGWTSIKEKNKKGEHEMDHVYMNEQSKLVLYFEQKNNINLDTEKSKSTSKKVKEVIELLKTKYPTYKVQGYIFAARYLHTSEDIANSIITVKYSNDNVVCVNEFLELFGLPVLDSYGIYKQIVAAVCEKYFGDGKDQNETD